MENEKKVPEDKKRKPRENFVGYRAGCDSVKDCPEERGGLMEYCVMNKDRNLVAGISGEIRTK